MKTKLAMALLLLPACAFAQTYSASTWLNFPAVGDGPVLPTGGLITDATGNLYGVSQGGFNSMGAIFAISRDGTLSVLHSFSGTDGSYPEVHPIHDRFGNLYGTTSLGGSNIACSCGTVFKLTAAGEFTLLYSFNGAYAYPSALTLDSAGNLYGFEYGSNLNGAIFEITPAGLYSVVYTFCSLPNCADGSMPVGRLIVDRAGNFYGATNRGGAFDAGTVFELTPELAESVVYSFTGGADGANPVGKLTQDAHGNMYGVTYEGGSVAGTVAGTAVSGTLYEITSSGEESVLYNFCQQTNCADGAHPLGSLARDASGNLYGTTTFGGANDSGVVFKIATNGTETMLADLSIDADGGNGALVDDQGNVYVEIYSGGTNNEGAVMKLSETLTNDLRP